MLENKNRIAFFIREVAKKIILEPQYPKDLDPDNVKLTVPYKSGVIATLQDIKDEIAKLGLDTDVDLGNLVDLTSEQTIVALKRFEDGLQSLIVPTKDEDVVRLKEIKDLLDTLNTLTDRVTKVETDIGDLNNINVELGQDVPLSIDNIINKVLEIIDESIANININYTNANKVPVTLGGVVKGTTFNEMPIQDVLTMLLYPYQEPAITQFTTPKTNFKLGEKTANTIQVTWNTSNQENIKDDSVKFKFNGQYVDTGKVFPKQGTDNLNITEFTKPQQGTVNLYMEITSTNDKKVGKTITLTWLNCIYYGNNTNTSITEAEAKQLTALDANSAGRDYKYPGGGYKYLVIPASWADPTSFIDPTTNFEVPMEKLTNISITNNFNIQQDYKVFRSTNVLNGDITVRVR